MRKLAIITSHPIQYNAPLFKILAARQIVQIKVFYTWGEDVLKDKYDPGFRKNISWDIPLLDGYEYEFLENVATEKGSHHFKGIINPSIIQRVDAFNPDALLIFGWAFSGHVKAMRYFKNKIPIYFRGDSTLLDNINKYKSIARAVLLKWIYKHIDFALFVGQNNKKYFLRYGLTEKQLIFAPHAIDNDRFSNPDEEYTDKANAWKLQLGIGINDVVIIFCGKLESKKNPLFLIEILKHCNSDRLKIIIVGNGTLESEIKKSTLTDSRLRLIGFQNQQQMPVVYRLADIYILPSIGPGETWGLAANEAMASGCAIMLSQKVGGAIDLVKEGENGIIFDPNDIKKCIEFIEQLLEDRKKLTQMKKASKRLINNFSFIHIATVVEQLVLQS